MNRTKEIKKLERLAKSLDDVTKWKCFDKTMILTRNQQETLELAVSILNRVKTELSR